MLLAQGAASAADPAAQTKPVHVTKEDLNPVRTYSAPNLLAHPSDPLVVVGAFADLRTRRCGLVRTVDGGSTWKILESSPSPASYPSCNSNPRGSFQGLLGFGRDNALYYALDGWDTQDGGIGGNVSMVVSKSTDLGDNWQPVIARDARGKTAEGQESYRPITGFAVDAKTGGQDRIYIGSGRRQPGFTGANALPVQPVIAASADGGKTFGEPVNLAETAFTDGATRQKAIQSATTTVPAPNATTTTTTTPPAGSRAATPDQAANFGGFGPSVTVSDKGTVYAMWPATYTNAIQPRPAGSVFLSRSDDQGKTWTTTSVTPFAWNIGSFSNVVWSPEGGAEGTLHAVADGYETVGVTGYQDIFHYRSTDGGRSWAERKNVTDDDPKQLFGQFYPNIAVAPGGRIEIRVLGHPERPGVPGQRRVHDDVERQRGDVVEERPGHRQADRPPDRRLVDQLRHHLAAGIGAGEGLHHAVVGRHPHDRHLLARCQGAGRGPAGHLRLVGAVRGAGRGDVACGQDRPGRRGRPADRRPVSAGGFHGQSPRRRWTDLREGQGGSRAAGQGRQSGAPALTAALTGTEVGRVEEHARPSNGEEPCYALSPPAGVAFLASM